MYLSLAPEARDMPALQRIGIGHSQRRSCGVGLDDRKSLDGRNIAATSFIPSNPTCSIREGNSLAQ
jgi:hypothetical protein